jgi:hypothetical protein
LQKSAHKCRALMYTFSVFKGRFFKAVSTPCTAAWWRRSSFRASMSSIEAGGGAEAMRFAAEVQVADVSSFSPTTIRDLNIDPG